MSLSLPEQRVARSYDLVRSHLFNHPVLHPIPPRPTHRLTHPVTPRISPLIHPIIHCTRARSVRVAAIISYVVRPSVRSSVRSSHYVQPFIEGHRIKLDRLDLARAAPRIHPDVTLVRLLRHHHSVPPHLTRATRSHHAIAHSSRTIISHSPPPASQPCPSSAILPLRVRRRSNRSAALPEARSEPLAQCMELDLTCISSPLDASTMPRLDPPGPPRKENGKIDW